MEDIPAIRALIVIVLSLLLFLFLSYVFVLASIITKYYSVVLHIIYLHSN